MSAELIRTEMSGARTWFGTLTLNPGHRSRVLMSAMSASGNAEWTLLSSEQQRVRLARAGGKLVTNYLKRVREQTGPGLRYCLVCEPHKDGMPHWHLLLHEASSDQPVRHAVLSRAWSEHGFSNWKLVENTPQAAGYVAKYLSKSPLARVRASVGYGQGA